MSGWSGWVAAAGLYAGFRAWYDNWGGRVSATEIETFIHTARARGADKLNDLEVLHKFLEQDDGREFIMLNLVRVPEGVVTDPDTGAQVKPRDMLQVYTRQFIRRLIRHGGHPALAARKVGGYVDAWQVPPDPGWTLVGFMRYRSRRDMLRMVSDPTFDATHKYKTLGVAETFSFPTQPFIQFYAGPRVWVFLVLALVAALL